MLTCVPMSWSALIRLMLSNPGIGVIRSEMESIAVADRLSLTHVSTGCRRKRVLKSGRASTPSNCDRRHHTQCNASGPAVQLRWHRK